MAKSRNTFTERDPHTSIRDPELVVRKEEVRMCATRKLRRYIPASMPTVCPDCGGSTRMDDGRHIDPLHATILEYRTCAKCGAKLAAGRTMTDCEKDRLCNRAEAIAEYESTLSD